jgi:hypothetical protein
MNPSTELRDLPIQLARAISDGDVATLERHTSRHPGTAVLGAEPDEPFLRSSTWTCWQLRTPLSVD